MNYTEIINYDSWSDFRKATDKIVEKAKKKYDVVMNDDETHAYFRPLNIDDLSKEEIEKGCIGFDVEKAQYICLMEYFKLLKKVRDGWKKINSNEFVVTENLKKQTLYVVVYKLVIDCKDDDNDVREDIYMRQTIINGVMTNLSNMLGFCCCAKC